MFNVLVSDPVSEQGIQALLEAADIHVDQYTDLTADALKTAIPTYDALLVRSQTQVTAEVLQVAGRLKVIGRAGVGVDNIDLDAATNHGILVVNSPDGNTISAAEHTMAMMMATARRIPQAYASLSAGKWDRKAFRGVELREKTLGVIGLGRIGTEVAKRAQAFDMQIMAYDPFLTKERAQKLGIEKGTVNEVCAQSEFLTVHTPITKETHHLIGGEQFQYMKNGARIVNCARGGIIDETALHEALQTGKIAGAALDVFESEPPTDSPLLRFPEVVVTPHLGASTEEAQENVAVSVSEDILQVLHNQPFKNAVNLPVVPDEVMQKINPYFLLAEKLGEMVVQLGKGNPVDVKITYAGELMDVDATPLTRTILKGMLSYYFGMKANDVNASELAKQNGLAYTVERTPNHGGFASLITVAFQTDEETHHVSGTLLNGYGARINNIDGYAIDISPDDHLLLIRHADLPGMIGRVGTLLAAYDVNIATMQVGRKGMGGRAIMMLTVDKKVSQQAREELETLADVRSVQEVEL